MHRFLAVAWMLAVVGATTLGFAMVGLLAGRGETAPLFIVGALSLGGATALLRMIRGGPR